MRLAFQRRPEPSTQCLGDGQPVATALGVLTMKQGDHLFLVDGSGYIFRAYHALPPLNRKSDGLPVSAVLGFSNMVWKLLQDAATPLSASRRRISP